MRKNVVKYIIAGILLIIVIFFVANLLSSQKNSELTEVTQITTPIISHDDAVYGSEDAKNTIVLFGYIGCENCEVLTSNILAFIDDTEEGSVQLVWKDYPNTSLAPHALSAALAARCAQEQGAFWEYQEYLRLNTNILNEELYVQIAKELDLKERKFTRCMNTNKTAEIVQSNISEGDQLKITAAPTLFINGERYTGAMNINEIRTLLVN